MKCQVELKDLQNAVRGLGTVIPPISVMSILSGILFDVSEGSMNIRATDLENTMQVTCPCRSDVAAKFVVDGKKVLELVRNFKDDIVTFTMSDDKVVVSSGRSKYGLKIMDVESFPELPDMVACDKYISVPLDEFINGLTSVSFCIDGKEVRPQFRGAFIETYDKGIRIVGTDTKQLSVYGIEMCNVSEIGIRFLLTLKAIDVFKSVCSAQDDLDMNIDIRLTDNQLHTSIGYTTLTMQLLSGAEDFPDYMKILDNVASYENCDLLVDSNELIEVLRRIKIFVSDRYQKMMFEIKHNLLNIHYSNPDEGDMFESVDIEYTGEDKKIALNDYILTALQKMSVKKVNMRVKGETLPVRLINNGGNWVYIVMPLRM